MAVAIIVSRLIIISVASWLIAFPIPGCFTVRARSVEWPGVYAFAEDGWILLPQTKPFRFHNINISHDQKPPPYALQMPDGKWVPCDQLTEEVLRPYLRPSDWNEPDWYVIGYRSGYVSIEIKDGLARRLHIGCAAVGWHWPQPGSPALGRIDGTVRHVLPVLEEQLIEIFGKPTASKDFWFDT